MTEIQVLQAGISQRYNRMRLLRRAVLALAIYYVGIGGSDLATRLVNAPPEALGHSQPTKEFKGIPNWFVIPV
jgi:hypothetical protein